MKEIDFSQLLQDGVNFAVYCKTEDDAKNFLKCLRLAYPRKCRTWDENETHWDASKNICYRPNLNMSDAYTLKYCDLEYYESNGFTILQYDDLLVRPDIAESDLSLEILLS